MSTSQMYSFPSWKVPLNPVPAHLPQVQSPCFLAPAHAPLYRSFKSGNLFLFSFQTFDNWHRSTKSQILFALVVQGMQYNLLRSMLLSSYVEASGDLTPSNVMEFLHTSLTWYNFVLNNPVSQFLWTHNGLFTLLFSQTDSIEQSIKLLFNHFYASSTIEHILFTLLKIFHLHMHYPCPQVQKLRESPFQFFDNVPTSIQCTPSLLNIPKISNDVSLFKISTGRPATANALSMRVRNLKQTCSLI